MFTIKVFTNQGCSLTEVSMYLIEEISCHLSLFVATPPFLSASPPVRPSRQQPAVYRHVITHHMSTLYYIRSADTDCLTPTVIYWLSVPAITGSVNKYHMFGGHLNLKSPTRTF